MTVAFAAAAADADARTAVVAALAHHERVLGAHLDLEGLVIPLLLELEPSELNDYSRSSIEPLARIFMRARRARSRVSSRRE